MKKFVFLLFTIISSVSFAGNNQLKIGDKAPLTNLKMKCVSGTSFTLDDVKKGNGLVVIFSCNTCPFVIKWEDRYNGLKKIADENNTGFVVLNSNHMKRKGDDSYEAMIKHAKANSYAFPYLVDDESLIANSFGAQTTPHVFFFDSDFKLVYKGAIDDNYDDASSVNKAYLKLAIKSLASNKTIEITESKPIGCSIKRKLN